MKAYPLFFEPDLKEKIWGGDQLKNIYQKKSKSNKIGESWEVAAHPNGKTIITNGALRGMSLEEAFEEYTDIIMGIHLQETDKFPLLLKIIDAKDQLSVQVHPEDDYANKYENGEFGKSEAWYILSAEPGAELIVGLKDQTSKLDFLSALEAENLESILKRIPVKEGDVINIPAGLVHAIGAGIVIAEIQQNSDTTYRVYDWNRRDDLGNKRELHIDKAIDVIDFNGSIPTELTRGHVEKFGNCTRTSYVMNEFFSLEVFEIGTEYVVSNKVDNFELYTCIEGQGVIHYETGMHGIRKGQSFMIPAGLRDFKIKGPLKLLRMCNQVNVDDMSDHQTYQSAG